MIGILVGPTMLDSSVDRLTAALKLEETKVLKLSQELGDERRQEEARLGRECRQEGQFNERRFLLLVADVNKTIIEKTISSMVALRRETIMTAPEASHEDRYRELLKTIERRIDLLFLARKDSIHRLIPTPTVSDAMVQRDQRDAAELKDKARLELEILKQEMALKAESTVGQGQRLEAKDKRKVFVVHGRNLKARDAMVDFLRAINLDPMEWSEAVAMTGIASPYIGQVLDHAFEEAQAVIVLITGDDVARLGSRYLNDNDQQSERELTPQARPNVIFEAGMAFGRQPERTVLVHLGKTRPFSDILGRHAVYITDEPKRRQELADRLRTAGCDVRIENRTDWHTAGNFHSVDLSPDIF